MLSFPTHKIEDCNDRKNVNESYQYHRSKRAHRVGTQSSKRRRQRMTVYLRPWIIDPLPPLESYKQYHPSTFSNLPIDMTRAIQNQRKAFATIFPPATAASKPERVCLQELQLFWRRHPV